MPASTHLHAKYSKSPCVFKSANETPDKATVSVVMGEGEAVNLMATIVKSLGINNMRVIEVKPIGGKKDPAPASSFSANSKNAKMSINVRWKEQSARQ